MVSSYPQSSFFKYFEYLHQKRDQVIVTCKYIEYYVNYTDITLVAGYLYFFIAEDYYRQTKTKLDKTKLNLITALRHCKRLRECRIKNELRYIVTPC